MHWRIKTMIEQLGGTGLTGAIVYCGGRDTTYMGRDDDAYPDPSYVDERGLVGYQIGICFRVNGKRGRNWKMLITLEPNDTYTVRLWCAATRSQQRQGIFGVVLDERTDVYADQLQEVVERVYDQAIKNHCDGFIPMS